MIVGLSFLLAGLQQTRRLPDTSTQGRRRRKLKRRLVAPVQQLGLLKPEGEDVWLDLVRAEIAADYETDEAAKHAKSAKHGKREILYVAQSAHELGS